MKKRQVLKLIREGREVSLEDFVGDKIAGYATTKAYYAHRPKDYPDLEETLKKELGYRTKSIIEAVIEDYEIQVDKWFWEKH